MKKTVKEAVAKIGCTKCDAVSTKKAWEKNDGTCPKCNNSTQGVAESKLTESDLYRVTYNHKDTDQKSTTGTQSKGNANELKAKFIKRGHKNVKVVGQHSVKESAKLTEGVLDDIDDDGFMAKRQLYDLAKDAVALHRVIQDTDDLEPWLQAKITKAADYIETVKEYLEYQGVAGAEDMADVAGIDDIAGIETAIEPEVALDTGMIGEDDGISEWDILRMAKNRKIISPESYNMPSPEMEDVALEVAQAHDGGELGGSDITYLMRNFVELCNISGVHLDGSNTHIYEAADKARQIYNRMLKGLRG